MSNSHFEIYNASAGSGKTYTLAKTYLKLLFRSPNPVAFKSILAITFTNKAVGEMKDRIISTLALFSNLKEEDKRPSMLNDICRELNLSEALVLSKSKVLLKHIIHNYGGFEVSTIDGFNHRLIRTFAHDLNLSVNFDVELDQERMLFEAVDALIAKAGLDEAITQILVEFAIEKIDDDKSWDISHDFQQIAKLILNENHNRGLESLSSKTLNDFKVLRQNILKEQHLLNTHITRIATEVLEQFNAEGLKYDDFSRSYVPNFFYKLAQGDLQVNLETKWQEDLVDGNPLYPKRVSEHVASKIEALQGYIANQFITVKEDIYYEKLLKAVYRNITPLSVLNAIKSELNTIKADQNLLLISEFNSLISAEIKDQPTPFIYERLGEKFKHFFIDEFQDTSKMQWENLIPLLDHALAGQDSSVMLVGDAKQAIYRWRGGDPEQFIDLFNKTSNPFQVEAQVNSLDTNYRSARAIVEFNNGLFKFLGEQFFADPINTELYTQATQLNALDSEGFVQLKLLDFENQEERVEQYADAVLNTIQGCLSKGYGLNDICVIARKHKEGVHISEYLSAHGIAITSSETLLLKHSENVRFINLMLKVLLEPNDAMLKVELLSLLALKYDIDNTHDFFNTHIHRNWNTEITFDFLNIKINRLALLSMPLYELVELIVRDFNFHNTSDAFIQFYLDTVLEFSQKHQSDIASFIAYFDNNSDKLSIAMPRKSDAVQIMTIHKSKGLEFPIVIFPFADLDIYKELNPRLWFPATNHIFKDFEYLLINYNDSVQYFGEVGKELYTEHRTHLQLDQINLLYVVLTRAVEQLYIISSKDIRANGEPNKKTFSGLFIWYLQHLGLWQEAQETYFFGSDERIVKRSEITLQSPIILGSTSKDSHNLHIVTKSGRLWDTEQEKALEKGNVLHLVLSKIKTKDDINFAVKELLTQGSVTKTNAEIIKDIVQKVICHPQLKPYFAPDTKTYIEHDIIQPSGKLVRPDRLVIDQKGEVTIIDYKTGAMRNSHRDQLYQYQTILEDMEYTVAKKLLVYLNDPIEVIEV